MSVSEPSKILTPWATSGLKNAIPSAADPVTGKAGYDQGFPAINMTAKEAGGIPPFGQDFNGIFFDITQILQYMQAGGHPTYSSALSTSIGGYPLGAMLAKASGLGFWRNITANNTTNPDSGGTGWVSDSIGSYANATVITASSTALTAAQVGQAFMFSTTASTVTLPAAPGVAAGGVYKLNTSAGFTLSVAGGGSMQAGNASVTSLPVPAGTEVLAVSTGSAWWVFGTGVIANSALFTSSKLSNGWRRTPDGFIEQWGVVAFPAVANPIGSIQTVTVTFPVSFISGVLTQSVTPLIDGGDSEANECTLSINGAPTLTTTTVKAYRVAGGNSSSVFSAYWRAIGY